MATLVKFRVHPNGDLFAFFPQLNFYGKSQRTHIANIETRGTKTCYSHIGQHSACAKDYERESKPAQESEYLPLKQELEQIGYKLKICK